MVHNMKSITIHNFEDDLEKSLASYSSLHKLSLNKSVKNLLRKALNVGQEKKEDFSDLCGKINKKQAQSIMKALKVFEKIDKEDWK